MPIAMVLESNFQTYFSNFENLIKGHAKFRIKRYSQIIQKRSL